MTQPKPEAQSRHDSIEDVGRFFMGTSEVHIAADRLVKKLEELGIPYAICGALAVNAHGHHRTTDDIDVVLTSDGLEHFKERAIGLGWLDRFTGSRGVKDTERGVPIDFLLTGRLPGDGSDHGVRFPDPADCAIEHQGKRYVALGKLIELKIAAALTRPDRPRDFDDVIQLIRKNALGEHFADALHPYVQPKYRELWGYSRLPTDEF